MISKQPQAKQIILIFVSSLTVYLVLRVTDARAESVEHKLSDPVEIDSFVELGLCLILFLGGESATQLQL